MGAALHRFGASVDLLKQEAAEWRTKYDGELRALVSSIGDIGLKVSDTQQSATGLESIRKEVVLALEKAEEAASKHELVMDRVSKMEGHLSGNRGLEEAWDKITKLEEGGNLVKNSGGAGGVSEDMDKILASLKKVEEGQTRLAARLAKVEEANDERREVSSLAADLKKVQLQIEEAELPGVAVTMDDCIRRVKVLERDSVTESELERTIALLTKLSARITD